MRRFVDEKGTEWDASVGRESWGTFVVLFTPVAGGEPRKALLSSEGMIEAQQEFDDLTDLELCDRLTASEPWA